MAHSVLSTSMRSAVIGFVATLAAFGGIQLHAQAFSGHNSNAPVQFDAGDIDVEDRENRVVLVGGVTVSQAGMTVRSQRMLVNYSDDGDLSIARITATGGVDVQRGNERARGDVAVYDLQRRIITSLASDIVKAVMSEWAVLFTQEGVGRAACRVGGAASGTYEIARRYSLAV